MFAQRFTGACLTSGRPAWTGPHAAGRSLTGPARRSEASHLGLGRRHVAVAINNTCVFYPLAGGGGGAGAEAAAGAEVEYVSSVEALSLNSTFAAVRPARLLASGHTSDRPPNVGPAVSF